jgi:hypothetical protein
VHKTQFLILLESYKREQLEPKGPRLDVDFVDAMGAKYEKVEQLKE